MLEILKVINTCFIQNLQTHEDKLKVRDVPNPEESFGVRTIFARDLNSQRRSILDINLKHGRVPSFNDVFFCNRNITIEQIHLFLMRSVSYITLAP
jgi:hypothetical protein